MFNYGFFGSKIKKIIPIQIATGILISIVGILMTILTTYVLCDLGKLIGEAEEYISLLLDENV